MNKIKIFTTLCLSFLFFNILLSITGSACKDIIAAGDATEGDFNLLMKVRDPSRPGLQVLCIVPEGYEYNYRNPWTGKTMSFTTKYKYIGVASKDDVIPNIVKAGMALSDAGIAYGDSDTNSRWINPTKNAWDDFDWIRYACQIAKTEDEAVKLLTEDAVKKMHATGVSENLFVVGPHKGFVVEADAFHYTTKEIVNGIDVRHNYPIELWKTQWLKLRPISKSFDTTVEKIIQKNKAIRLGSIFGIRIVEIGDDHVSVKPIGLFHAMKTKNIGVVTKIQIDERKSVGEFSVKLIEINGNKAKIFVSNIYKAWEDEIMKYINPRYGSITVNDMINWSRLTSEDLDGLRGMSQTNREYESVAINKIPKQNYEALSMGWFSANNAVSSIYVPFHISNTNIFDPYENGDAAQLSLDLSQVYNDLSENFSKTEKVFLYETDFIEDISAELIDEKFDVSDFLTISDMGMQRQAYMTENLWMEASKTLDGIYIMKILAKIWDSNYSTSLDQMKNALVSFDDNSGNYFVNKIMELSLDICKTRMDAAKAIGKQSPDAEIYYEKANQYLEQGNYNLGFKHLKNAYDECTLFIKGQALNQSDEEISKEKDRITLYFYIFLIIIAIILLIFVLNKKH